VEGQYGVRSKEDVLLVIVREGLTFVYVEDGWIVGGSVEGGSSWKRRLLSS
jgi:hypothetical protein